MRIVCLIVEIPAQQLKIGIFALDNFNFILDLTFSDTHTHTHTHTHTYHSFTKTLYIGKVGIKSLN